MYRYIQFNDLVTDRFIVEPHLIHESGIVGDKQITVEDGALERARYVYPVNLYDYNRKISIQLEHHVPTYNDCRMHLPSNYWSRVFLWVGDIVASLKMTCFIIGVMVVCTSKLSLNM